MNPLKRLTISSLLLVCLAACLISCKRHSPGQPVEQSAVPVSGSASPAPCALRFNGKFVNDTGGVLSEDSRNKLEQKLDTLKNVGNIDFAVVTVRATKEQDISDYSLALARCWSVGAANPDGAGMLLMFAVDDRKWRLQISRSLEKVLSNEEIQEAGRQMTPHLREARYYEGIDKFIDATLKTIAPRRKFSMPASEP